MIAEIGWTEGTNLLQLRTLVLDFNLHKHLKGAGKS